MAINNATAKALGSENTVESKHSDHIQWMRDSLLVRSLMKGTKGMKEQGERFLPRDYLEKEEIYKVRLSRSTLLNAFDKTVNFLGGQVFSKPLVFSEDTPVDVLEWNKDIDLKGNDINVFAKGLFELGIGEGVVHVIVDTTNKDGDYTSKKEEKEAGVRPYFRKVKGENLFAFVDEGGVLQQIRIYESVSVKNGEFGVDVVDQIRVIEPGAWRTYRAKSNGQYDVYESGTNSLSYLAIASFIPGKNKGPLFGESPLSDLAELNLDHWQSRSDQKNILHHARVPKMFGRMLDVEALENSVHSMVVSNDEQGDLKWVEIRGKSIEVGQKDLTETEAKMALWGLQQLIPRTGSQTATEKAIAASESHSSLGSWASDFEDFLRLCYSFMADFEATTYPEEMVTVNQEFSIGLIDAGMIGAYQNLVDTKILSAESAFSEIKRKGFIGRDLDWLDVSAQLTKETSNSTLLPDTFE